MGIADREGSVISSEGMPETLEPFVSVLIPMRNEERYIGRCLDSLLENDYPLDRVEIVVIDGMSTDRSREMVEQYSKRYPLIRIVENEKRFQAAGLNLGIRDAVGEIIIRVDAHTTYASDYIRQCVAALQTSGAVNVGGVQHAVGTGIIGNAIAIAITSKFGTGNARFRCSNHEERTDTVYLGAWYTRTLRTLGGFNEEVGPNEDYELNYRLRQLGGKILLSPKVRSQYYVRESLGLFARQYLRYGFWKMKTLVVHPDSLRWRHLFPPALVLGVIVSLALLPLYWQPCMLITSLYVIAGLGAAFGEARHRGWRYLPLLPIAFASIHLSWGLGFWVGMIRFGVPRLSWKLLAQAFALPGSEPK